MGLLRRPTPGEIVEGGRVIPQHGWRWSCPDAHRLPTCRLGHRNDSPTVRSDASCMASTPRVMPATSSGPAVVSPASMRADTAPNHPIRVRTAHPGWAHPGRQPVGWAKGARSGERRAGQGRCRGLPLRLSAAWRERWHDGCCRPDRSVQHPRPGPGEVARTTTSRPGRSRTSLPRRSAQRSGHCVDRRPHQQRRWS